MPSFELQLDKYGDLGLNPDVVDSLMDIFDFMHRGSDQDYKLVNLQVDLERSGEPITLKAIAKVMEEHGFEITTNEKENQLFQAALYMACNNIDRLQSDKIIDSGEYKVLTMDDAIRKIATKDSLVQIGYAEYQLTDFATSEEFFNHYPDAKNTVPSQEFLGKISSFFDTKLGTRCDDITTMRVYKDFLALLADNNMTLTLSQLSDWWDKNITQDKSADCGLYHTQVFGPSFTGMLDSRMNVDSVEQAFEEITKEEFTKQVTADDIKIPDELKDFYDGLTPEAQEIVSTYLIMEMNRARGNDKTSFTVDGLFDTTYGHLYWLFVPPFAGKDMQVFKDADHKLTDDELKSRLLEVEATIEIPEDLLKKKQEPFRQTPDFQIPVHVPDWHMPSFVGDGIKWIEEAIHKIGCDNNIEQICPENTPSNGGIGSASGKVKLHK